MSAPAPAPAAAAAAPDSAALETRLHELATEKNALIAQVRHYQGVLTETVSGEGMSGGSAAALGGSLLLREFVGSIQGACVRG